MLTAVYKESKLFKNIFVNEQSEELQKYFFDHCYTDLMILLQEKKEKGLVFSEKEEVIAAFYAGGISSLLRWWIVAGFPISVDEIAKGQDRMLKPLFDMH